MSFLEFYYKGYEGKIFRNLYFTSNRGIVAKAILEGYLSSKKILSYEEIKDRLPITPLEVKSAYNRVVVEFLRSYRLDITDSGLVDNATLADYKKVGSKDKLPKALDNLANLAKAIKAKGIKLEPILKPIAKATSKAKAKR